MGVILVLQVCFIRIISYICYLGSYTKCSQALIESKRNPSRGHILRATHSIVLFGVPHPGATCGLEEMLDPALNESGQTREDLLGQLSEGSDFLENHRKDLDDIWNMYKPSIFGFYGTSTTDMVRPRTDSPYAELIFF